MRSRWLTLLASPLALVLWSCGGGGTQSPVALPMQDHWDAGQELWSAMAQGDLSNARTAASRIADIGPVQGLAWDAGPYLREMRNEATNVADATEFEVAALAAGRMAVACGSCHARAEVEIGAEIPVVIPGNESLQSHMFGHEWAMNRMWEALVLPDRNRWTIGANVLARHELSTSGMSESIGFLAERVHEQGRLAADDVTPAARGDRFGRILSDCAACHAEVGVGEWGSN